MTYPGIENDRAALDANPDLAAVVARRAERETEYYTYVATEPIPWGNILAFPVGSQVPVSTVQRLKWDEMGLVAKRTTKAGRAAIEAAGSYLPGEEDRFAEEDKAAEARKAQAQTENQEAVRGETEDIPDSPGAEAPEDGDTKAAARRTAKRSGSN
jgi:hypothetical protein